MQPFGCMSSAGFLFQAGVERNTVLNETQSFGRAGAQPNKWGASASLREALIGGFVGVIRKDWIVDPSNSAQERECEASITRYDDG